MGYSPPLGWPRALPMLWCGVCKLAFVSNRDGKSECPHCHRAPMAVGVPIAQDFQRGYEPIR